MGLSASIFAQHFIIPLFHHSSIPKGNHMDLAILSARIFTGNAKQPWVEALGIKDNKIALVGSNAQVKKACRRSTQIVELKGKLVTPGFVDAHTHFVNFGLTLQRVALMSLPSLAECRRRIGEAAASSSPGEWIIGRGWNEHFWEERREPTRFDLDDLTPRNPAMMIRACGHSVWVNTEALAAGGITRDTADPPGSRIERDPVSGEPTGLLRELRRHMEKFIPPPTLETRKRAALAAQEEALRFGVTGVHSCETLREWEALSALEEEGKLKIRVHETMPYDGLDEGRSRSLRPWRGGQRLWFGQVKLYADGSLGSGTALLHAPYADHPADRGLAVLTPQALRKRVMESYRNGYSVAIHAIGDKAVTNSLKAIASARNEFPGARRDNRARPALGRDLQFRTGWSSMHFPRTGPRRKRSGERPAAGTGMPGDRFSARESASSSVRMRPWSRSTPCWAFRPR
jgi:predicted amidohydrolase YtcJ